MLVNCVTVKDRGMGGRVFYKRPWIEITPLIVPVLPEHA